MEDPASGPEESARRDRARDRRTPWAERDARRGRAAHARAPCASRSAGITARSGKWTAPARRCAGSGTWQCQSRPVRRVCRGGPEHGVRARHRLARPRLGRAAVPPGLPTSSSTAIFLAPRPPDASACTARSRCRFSAATDVLGVMEFFSRDIRQPDAALLETMMRRGGPDRAVPGSQVGGRRAGSVLQPVARSVVRRQPGRVLPPSQSRVAHVLGFEDAELLPRPSSTSSIPTIAPRRSSAMSA